MLLIPEGDNLPNVTIFLAMTVEAKDSCIYSSLSLSPLSLSLSFSLTPSLSSCSKNKDKQHKTITVLPKTCDQLESEAWVETRASDII